MTVVLSSDFLVQQKEKETKQLQIEPTLPCAATYIHTLDKNWTKHHPSCWNESITFLII